MPKFFLWPEIHLQNKYGVFDLGIHHPLRSAYIFKKLTKFPHFGLTKRISKKPFLGQLMLREGIDHTALPHLIQQANLRLDRQNQTVSIVSLSALMPIFDEKLGILDLASSHEILCCRLHVNCVATLSNFLAISTRTTLLC